MLKIFVLFIYINAGVKLLDASFCLEQSVFSVFF